MKRTIQLLQEFSIPLIAGVVIAMIFANMDAELYHALVHTPLTDLHTLWGHATGNHEAHVEGWKYFFTLHFLANDIFMVLFFGIAAKEITEACLPGGALNPISKAINPLAGTLGGVLGPIGVYLALNAAFGQPEWVAGWGIPTATDIALAWLLARMLFGKGHPAVSFLLLLAVADDAIGLGIIAVGYPDPAHPTQWMNLLWAVPGMVFAWSLRQCRVQSWVPYIVIGGAFAWWGLYSAHLHPALALVFIVPFLPAPPRDAGLFEMVQPENEHTSGHHALSPLQNFEHSLKAPVDFGLFAFAFANAGVPLAEVNGLTWIVLAALLVGKVVGITGMSWAAAKAGFPLPLGMNMRHLVLTSVIAALGLTVALFVSSQAFTDSALQGAARMGAVLSAGVAVLAFAVREVLGLRTSRATTIAVQDDDSVTTPQSGQQVERELVGSR